MRDKSVNFIRLRKCIVFKREFSHLVANHRGIEGMKKNYKFQLNISKIMPAGPQLTDTWALNTTISRTEFTLKNLLPLL